MTAILSDSFTGIERFRILRNTSESIGRARRIWSTLNLGGVWLPWADKWAAGPGIAKLVGSNHGWSDCR